MTSVRWITFYSNPSVRLHKKVIELKYSWTVQNIHNLNIKRETKLRTILHIASRACDCPRRAHHYRMVRIPKDVCGDHRDFACRTKEDLFCFRIQVSAMTQESINSTVGLGSNAVDMWNRSQFRIDKNTQNLCGLRLFPVACD